MANIQGVLTLFAGMVLGLIGYYPTGQKDWVALLICGAVMVPLDLLSRMLRSSGSSGLKRLWHPSKGGHLMFIPNWVLGLVQLGHVLSGNAA